jgi:hypothetical protein
MREFKGSGRGSGFIFKGSGRGSGFANQEVNRENRPTHPGRGVRFDANGIAGFNAHVVTGSVATKIKCFSCSEFGHVARDCRKISRHGDEGIMWETACWDGRAARLDPSSSFRLY